MFSTFLGYLENSLVVGSICLVLGVVFSQKIKDWLLGVPTDFRKAMVNVEAKAKADVQAAISDVFAKINPPALKPPAPAAIVPVPVPAPAPEAPKA